MLTLVYFVRYCLPRKNERGISGAAILDSCPDTSQPDVINDLRLVKEAMHAGLHVTRRGSADNTWDIWQQFCESLHCDPYLQTIHDPIPLLQIFAHRYRTGALAPSGSTVHSRTVEGALRSIGQTLATLGSQDPRLQPSGKLNLHLARQLTSYKKADPPPTRVKPIPFPIIAHTANISYISNTPKGQTIADMLILGFFFLLRPGEYMFTTNPEAAPFQLQDAHFLINDRRLNYLTCAEQELLAVNFIALEFTS